MRNTFTIYSRKTDLRGKKVELRSGEVVEIPKDAKLWGYRMAYVLYEAAGLAIFQNCQRKNNTRNSCDIMKVIK